MDVKIIHPETGLESAVPEESLWQWHAAGWRRLTEAEEQAAAPEPEPEPEPVTRAQAAQAAKASSTTAEKES
jgi:hypothetical protein